MPHRSFAERPGADRPSRCCQARHSPPRSSSRERRNSARSDGAGRGSTGRSRPAGRSRREDRKQHGLPLEKRKKVRNARRYRSSTGRPFRLMKEIGCGPGISPASPAARCAYHYSAKGGRRDRVIPGQMAARTQRGGILVNGSSCQTCGLAPGSGLPSPGARDHNRELIRSILVWPSPNTCI